jgi:hypothetical protein
VKCGTAFGRVDLSPFVPRSSRRCAAASSEAVAEPVSRCRIFSTTSVIVLFSRAALPHPWGVIRDPVEEVFLGLPVR